MSYALTPLTPVWCEVNVFLSFYIFLCYLLFFCLFLLSLLLFCYCLCPYLCLFILFLVIQSDLEKLKMNLLVLFSLVNGLFVNN